MEWKIDSDEGKWQRKFAVVPTRVGKKTVWWEHYEKRRCKISKNIWEYEYRLQSGYEATERVTDRGWTDIDGMAICAHEWVKD